MLVGGQDCVPQGGIDRVTNAKARVLVDLLILVEGEVEQDAYPRVAIGTLVGQ